MTIRRMPMYMPDAIKVPLKFTQAINLAAETFDTIGFALNDPFEHQPYGWDQWAALYTHFYCQKSKVNLKWTTENADQARLILFPSQYLSTTPVSWEQVSQQKYAKMYAIGGSSSPVGRMKHFMSVTKLDGFRPTGVNYQGTTESGLSATYTRYWNIWVESLSGQAVDDIVITIELTYYVRFFRLTLQTTS